MTTSMTRQHFNAIAHAIATTYGITPAEREAVASSVAHQLRAFNPNFNRDRFIAAATRNVYGERNNVTHTDVTTGATPVTSFALDPEDNYPPLPASLTYVAPIDPRALLHTMPAPTGFHGSTEPNSDDLK